ncbi:MAG: Competence protein ComEC [Parcubacteria group bacterium]|nr:Competence protein ComEC [Parcubacteria group bacterium]
MNIMYRFQSLQELYKKFEDDPQRGVFLFIWGFMFGVLVSSFFSISPLAACFIMLIGGAIYGADRRNILLFLFFLSFGAGIVRFDIKDFHTPEPLLESGIDTVITREGVVVSEPENRENDMRFVLKTDTDKILVSTPLLTRVSYGDRARVTGKLKKPGIIESDTGRTFDYAAYLSKDDIYYTESFAKVEVLGSGQGNFLKAFLLRIKSAFTNRMNSILPEPESSLLAGLLVSGKQALPASVLDEFKRAGVVHIVVLSGYNITIIAEFFLLLLGFLGSRRASVISGVGIILFTLMTGATATVVRAAVMALIVLMGKTLGRGYSMPRALLSAAFLMLVLNPKILVFDPSFQLSFLAVLALVYVEPIIKKYFVRVPERWGMRSILSTTVATQITVLPYLVYSVGSVSVVSLVSNILILVFVPFTMLAGFFATLLAFIHPYIALPFAYVSHILLAYILFVAHTLGSLPWASIRISHLSWWLAVLIYLVFGAIVWRLRSSLQPSAN